MIVRGVRGTVAATVISSLLARRSASLAGDSLGAPFVKLLGADVDGLREKNLFTKLQSVDATPGSSLLIVSLLGLGSRAHRGLSVVRLLDEEAPQGFFDNGFLVRELAGLDLLSQKAL